MMRHTGGVLSVMRVTHMKVPHHWELPQMSTCFCMTEKSEIRFVTCTLYLACAPPWSDGAAHHCIAISATSAMASKSRQMDENAAQLATFLESKERVREGMNGARVGVNELRVEIAESLRDFEVQLERLRKKVEPLIVIPATKQRVPLAPHSTPIG